MTHNIGVLIPQSNAYPLIGKEFIHGLKLGLGNTDFKLSIESIAFGSDPKQITNATQKLFFQEDTCITTVLLGHYGLSELTEFVSKNDEILLMATMGATRPFDLPNGTFQNSFGLYNALQDLVHHFDKNNVSKIETSTCYYESGYGFIEALATSLENASNVEFSGHFITPHEPRENEAELMMQHISEDNPEAIVAFHNGVFAKEHATFLAENNMHEKYPIYALPFSCEDSLINDHENVFQEITTVSSWYPQLENESNKKFVADYVATKGKNPSFFALLGYENGLIIANALKQNSGSLKTAIADTHIDGPRGPIAFDNESNSTAFDQHLWKINGSDKTVISKLEANPKKTDPLQEDSDAKGWFNAYLCH